MAPPRPRNKADRIVAATAGLDNWKTWAGRSRGSDQFEWWDLVRGTKQSWKRQFGRTVPPSGTACPVCLMEPSKEEWFVTSSCLHAVCIDCLQGYAANQVQDVHQTGPLKCPVCPQVLRRADAVVALSGDNSHDLVQHWDDKLRNQLLRALPAFRSCPNCSKNNTDNNNNSTNMQQGGGFVTPECLGPHHQERRESAIQILNGIWMAALGVMGVYILFCVYISFTPSSSPLVDLIIMLMPPTLFLFPILIQTEAWVARAARQALLQPLTVECPCCDTSFLLPTEAHGYDEQSETAKWMTENTRPCPSCSVPITKAGGCNHMKCTHCQASFCWACMKLQTTCQAFRCRNGAPFRNAVPEEMILADQLPAAAREVSMWISLWNLSFRPSDHVTSGSLLTLIDTLLERQQEHQQEQNPPDATAAAINGQPAEQQSEQIMTTTPPLWKPEYTAPSIFVFLALFGRHMSWLNACLHTMSAPVLWFLTTIASNLGKIVTGWLLLGSMYDHGNHHLVIPERIRTWFQDRWPTWLTTRRAVAAAEEEEPPPLQEFRTEQEMVREALRRSLEDH